MKPAKGRLAVAVTTLLILGEVLFAGGGVVFAQTTTDILDAMPTEEIVISTNPILPNEEISVDTTGGTDLQGASSTPQLQETFSDQETVPPDASSTIEIIFATSTDPVPPIVEEATTTPEVVVPDPDVVPPTDEIIPDPIQPVEPEVVPPEETPPPQVDPQQEQGPMVLSAEVLKPESKYVFSFTGKKVSTTRRVRRTHMERSRPVASVVSEAVNSDPVVTADNTTGVMSVSGACEDKYYVILVYRHEEDYAQDPGSYVVNRSFPCENGNFVYNVTNLPPSLSNGNYYLLVGSMGETTPWVPITSITEVTLARSQ